jgi:SAM-dependent methyltransferase
MHGFRDTTHRGSAGSPDRTARAAIAAALRSRHEAEGTGWSWYTWAFEQVRANTPEVAAVLDVAAGTGALWSYNYERLPMAWWVWLTDESPGAVSELRNALDGAPQVTVAHGRLGDLPLGNAAFDTIVANHILDDMDDPELALDEIQRVLRPGGRLIAATDGPRHLVELTELARLASGRALPVQPVSAQQGLARIFDLEGGRAALAERFTSVRCERFAATTRLTDPDEVVALIHQGPGAIPADRLARIQAEVGAVINRYGHYRLTVDTGILIATAR